MRKRTMILAATTLAIACNGSGGGCNLQCGPDGRTRELVEQCMERNILFRQGDRFRISIDGTTMAILDIVDIRKDRAKIIASSPEIGMEFEWRFSKLLMIGGPAGRVTINSCDTNSLDSNTITISTLSDSRDIEFTFLRRIQPNCDEPPIPGRYTDSMDFGSYAQYGVVYGGNLVLIDGTVMDRYGDSVDLSIYLGRFGITTNMEFGDVARMHMRDYGEIYISTLEPKSDDMAVRLRVMGDLPDLRIITPEEDQERTPSVPYPRNSEQVAVASR